MIIRIWYYLLILMPSLPWNICAEARSRGSGSGSVHVGGYTRKNGTYVQPHNRTSPNGTKNDNWSTRGNVNPYTGADGSKDGDGFSASSPGFPASASEDSYESSDTSTSANGNKPGLPANAKLDYFGHDWECKRGFVKRGQECNRVTSGGE